MTDHIDSQLTGHRTGDLLASPSRLHMTGEKKYNFHGCWFGCRVTCGNCSGRRSDKITQGFTILSAIHGSGDNGFRCDTGSCCSLCGQWSTDVPSERLSLHKRSPVWSSTSGHRRSTCASNNVYVVNTIGSRGFLELHLGWTVQSTCFHLSGFLDRHQKHIPSW